MLKVISEGCVFVGGKGKRQRAPQYLREGHRPRAYGQGLRRWPRELAAFGPAVVALRSLLKAPPRTLGGDVIKHLHGGA